MKRGLWNLKRIWTSEQGETLPELLISVLIIVLGLTMFASALVASRKMLAEGDTILKTYYQERNVLEQESQTAEGELILKPSKNLSDSRINFALPQAITSEKGKYKVNLYSEQTGTGTSAAKYYRYRRQTN